MLDRKSGVILPITKNGCVFYGAPKPFFIHRAVEGKWANKSTGNQILSVFRGFMGYKILISLIGFGPHITVINHDETTTTHKPGAPGGVASGSGSFLGPHGGEREKGGGGVGAGSGRNIITGAPSPSQLSRQGSSVESHASSVPIHFHTAECSAAGRSLHQPTHHSKVCPECLLVVLGQS